MVDFSALKKDKNYTALQQKLKDTSGGSSRQKDDRFFSITLDKAKTGTATIRFLPTSPADHGKLALPVGEYFQHGFKNPKNQKWFIDTCPTSLGAGTPCPVCEANSELFNSGVEDNKTIARKRKRKKWYVANIYVVNDPGNQENNGKVFLYRFGKQIFDKINLKLNPQFDDDVSVNIFDLWEGANFKLRQTFEDDFPKFDKSDFDIPSPLLGGNDAALEKIWRGQHSLLEFTPEGLKETIKSYDELKTNFDRVMKGAPANKSAGDEMEDRIENSSQSNQKAASSPAERFAKKTADTASLPEWEEERTSKASSAKNDDIDDILAEFEKANKDIPF